MAREFSRSRRVEEAIQRILGEALAGEVRDPRLAGLTITHVEVSRDLAVARVYYTLADGVDAGEVEAGLKTAGGFFRTAVARQLRMRKVPELRFRLDETLARARALEDLILQAVTTDAAGQPVAAAQDEPDRES